MNEKYFVQSSENVPLIKVLEKYLVREYSVDEKFLVDESLISPQKA